MHVNPLNYSQRVSIFELICMPQLYTAAWPPFTIKLYWERHRLIDFSACLHTKRKWWTGSWQTNKEATKWPMTCGHCPHTKRQYTYNITPVERQPWWKTTLMNDHHNERKTSLMATLSSGTRYSVQQPQDQKTKHTTEPGVKPGSNLGGLLRETLAGTCQVFCLNPDRFREPSSGFTPLTMPAELYPSVSFLFAHQAFHAEIRTSPPATAPCEETRQTQQMNSKSCRHRKTGTTARHELRSKQKEVPCIHDKNC